jgi:pantoate--beta-alanine ligase
MDEVIRPVVAHLGLGSNVGDRRAHLTWAVERLRTIPGVEVRAVSSWIETAPVGGPPQGDYLNGAVELSTTLPPQALLSVCKEIERARGRDLSAPRDSPRPLDLDVLLYGDSSIDTKTLQVPHPRLLEREFALRPLRELGVDPTAIPAASRPRVVREPAELASLASTWHRGGCTVGLVPTMGALHAGHASLAALARAECDRVAASIFVNPLQFAAGEDFAAYPRSLERDVELLRGCGVDAVFAPDAAAMQPPGFATRLAVGAEAEDMEGARRPGHFSGVATVVAQLLALARPTHAYFGEKDAQQVAVVQRMCRDLGFPTTIRVCPTVRDRDGVALSSRNAYLGPADRKAAAVLYAALSRVRAAHAEGERDEGRLAWLGAAAVAAEPRAQLDYFEVRGGRAYVAARFEGDSARPTRLIDNVALDGSSAPSER